MILREKVILIWGVHIWVVDHLKKDYTNTSLCVINAFQKNQSETTQSEL